MVKTSPSNAGGVGSIPDQGAKISHVHGQNPKMENSCHIITNSIKILNMVYIKKIFKKINIENGSRVSGRKKRKLKKARKRKREEKHLDIGLYKRFLVVVWW